jgi:hypothetical protein
MNQKFTTEWGPQNGFHSFAPILLSIWLTVFPQWRDHEGISQMLMPQEMD